jgi:hypothetical protein
VSDAPVANPSSQGAGRSGGQIGDRNESAGDRPRIQYPSLESSTSFQTAASSDGIRSAPGFRGGGTQYDNAGESLSDSPLGEFEARTDNAATERGSSSGGSFNRGTSRDSPSLHGQLSYLNRQGLWGAQNPFTQWVHETTPAAGIDTAQFAAEPYTPADHRQAVDIGAGGEFKRRKLFWFVAVDGVFRNDPAVATVRHPDHFFARPSDNELNAFAARLDLPDVLEQTAATYSTWLEQLDGLLGPVPRSSTQWKGFGRLDWRAGERHHLSMEADAAWEDAPAGALARSSETYGSHSFGNSRATEARGLARAESFLSPNLLNSAAVQYRRHIQSQTPQTPSPFESNFLANAWGQLPEIIVDSKYGFVLGKPASLGLSNNPGEESFMLQDTISWARGPHLVRTGGSFDHVADTVGTLLNQTGTYSYADVLNFVSDAASFSKYGVSGVNDPTGAYHNCDAAGRIYTKKPGLLGGLGSLPCYAWYSQRIGPSDWKVSTNDLAAFATEQWQPWHNLTLSAGVRVEAEQLPSPLASVENPDLPTTQKLPPTTLNWGPRVGLAWTPNRTTVLRLGAGLYFGRIDNSAVLAGLSQTGSPNGDLNYFFRPTDAGAPPFPYVFSATPQTVVTPGAVSFAPRFRPQEVDQAEVSIEQELPGHWLVSVGAMTSLGRRLPISIDSNIDPALDSKEQPQTITYEVVDALGAGPIKSAAVTVPFYTSRPNSSYQQLASIESRANSTYDAAVVKLVRYGSRGLSLHARYLYAHATDWNPNESGEVAVNDVLDPADFRLEYGTSNLDIRHSAGATLLYRAPWKLHNWAGELANGWSVATVGQFRSGLPFTVRTSGYIPGFYDDRSILIEGVGPGINGSGGDNRIYTIGRNTYRYPATYTADARLAKRFNFAAERELEFLAESFNLFNHQNVTLIETTGYIIDRGTTTGGPPTLNFLTGLTSSGAPSTIPEFGKPLDVNATNFYRQRQIQLGLRARF